MDELQIMLFIVSRENQRKISSVAISYFADAVSISVVFDKKRGCGQDFGKRLKKLFWAKKSRGDCKTLVQVVSDDKNIILLWLWRYAGF